MKKKFKIARGHSQAAGAGASGATSRRAAPGRLRGIVIGVLGWLAAIGAGALVILLPGANSGKAACETARANAQMEQFRLKTGSRIAACRQKSNALREQIKTIVNEETRLLHQIQERQAERAALEHEVGSLEKDIAALEQTISRTQNSTDADSERVEDLEIKLDRMKKTTRRLFAAYRKQYAELKARYEEAVRRSEPWMIRQFYGRYPDSPYAPAACFFTAEKMYAARDVANARRMYKTLLKQFSDSPYSLYVRKRLAQLDARLRYRPWDVPVKFYPYKPFLTRED
jgi:TolA-binding protein